MRDLRTPAVREKIHEGGMFAQMMNDPGCSCQVTTCLECPGCSYEVPEELIAHCPKCGEAIGTYGWDGVELFES